MIRRLIIFGVMVVGFMTLGGYLGWSQGYTAGLAAEADWIHGFGGAAVPLFLGLGLLKIFFFVFLFLFISKFLFRGWKSHGRAYSGHWGSSLDEWHSRHHNEQVERNEDDDKPAVA